MDKAKIYLGEIHTQISFAKKSYDAYLVAKNKDDIPDMFLHIHHFVIHATNIDKLIDVSPLTFRGKILNGHLDMSGIDLKLFRKLRNHLEHFDERLDKWVKEFDGFPFFDMNLVTGAKGFPDRAFLRALDGNNFRFHGESYNLAELYEQIKTIEGRIGEGD